MDSDASGDDGRSSGDRFDRAGVATMTTDRRSPTEAEQEAMRAAVYLVRAHGSGDHPERMYLDALPEARWSVARRLLLTLLRRPPADFPDAVFSSSDRSFSDVEQHFPPSVSKDHVHDLARSMPADCSTVGFLPFPASEASLVVPVAAVHGYERYRPIPPVLSVASATASPIGHPLEVVEFMDREGAFNDEAHAAQFCREIDQGVANRALSTVAERTLRQRWEGAVHGLPWAPDGPAQSGDPAVTLERLVAVHGHPTNPCSESRLEMSAVDSLRFAPEFSDRVDIRFVAVPATRSFHASTGGSPSMKETLLGIFDGLDDAFKQALPAGADPEAYDVLPVHPWQFRETVLEPRVRPGDNGLVPLPEFTWPATPLCNLRTVVPHGSGPVERLPHVKLSIAVRKMGVPRHLQPGEVYNGPYLSEVLGSIIEAESVDGFGVLDEFVGACHRPTAPVDSGVSGGPTEGCFGTILRVNPYNHSLVGDGDVPITSACLLADRPDDQGSIVGRFVNRFADAGDLSSTRDAVEEFLEAYLDCVLPGPIRLMTKYGVGLEPHSQNTIVVFDRDARPKAALVRDFGGIRIQTDRLESCGYVADVYPGSAVDASTEEMYEMIHALLVRQVGELIVALVREYDVDEDGCWRLVRNACEEEFDRLRSDPEVPASRVDRDGALLFGEAVPMRAMSALRGEGGPRYRQVSNPLATASTGGR